MAQWACKQYGLDGYIANAEDPYEGPANYWRSGEFLREWRGLAPHAPLALSYIGEGHPHRDMPLWDWEDEGAVMMPQCYWATEATSLWPSWDAALRAGLTRSFIVPSLGTSGFAKPYPVDTYVAELRQTAALGRGRGFNVWLLDSTPDDLLRPLAQVI